jgi:hypothetical protein
LESPFAAVLPECDDRQIVREAVSFGLLEESERGDLRVSLDLPMNARDGRGYISMSLGAAILLRSSSLDAEVAEESRELKLSPLSLLSAVGHLLPFCK